MATRAAIVRAFPKYAYSFCFDHARQRLVFYSGTKICLLQLKTGALTEITANEEGCLGSLCFSSDDRYIYALGRSRENGKSIYRIDTQNNAREKVFTGEHPIQLFRASPDGHSLFLMGGCGTALENQSQIIEIDSETGKILDCFMAPLAQCLSLAFVGKKIRVSGKNHHMHREFDHDEFLYETREEHSATLLLHADEQPKNPSGRPVRCEFLYDTREESADDSGAFPHTLPPDIEIYDSKPAITAFCNLCVEGKLLQQIPHFKLVHHRSNRNDFPCYALLDYTAKNRGCSSHDITQEGEEEFTLLIGYEDDR